MNADTGKSKPLTKDETKYLLSLIEKAKTITSKTTNASNNRLKNEAWNQVAESFNATSTMGPRTPAQLRLKWENLKKNARKRSTVIRMNQIKTGGGPGDYVPPDDILDRVTSLLGNTVSGFVVPFGGDREPEGSVLLGGNEEDSGEGPIGGDAAINLESLEFEDTPIPASHLSMASVPSSGPVHVEVLDRTKTPEILKRVKFTTPMTGKRKFQDGSKQKRNIAIAEYYTMKKKCLEAKLDNILLENENLKLNNEKLKLELEFFKKQ